MSKGKKQIPFDFCKIGRAAKFLNIEVSDLLSLAVSRKITLCVRFDGLNALLWAKGDVEELSHWYLSLESNHYALALSRNISKYSAFSIDRLSFSDDGEDDPIFNPWFYPSGSNDTDEMSISHEGRAYGLWVPQLPVINTILNYGASDLSGGSLDLYRTEESTPELCLIPLPLNNADFKGLDDDSEEPEAIYPDAQITEDDLWITSEQVRMILDYQDDLSGLNGIESYNDLGRIPTTKMLPPRMNVHQFTLIYALMKVVGFTDDEMKNSSGDAINKKLENIGKEKGISMPQPDKNTWLKWREKLLEIMR